MDLLSSTLRMLCADTVQKAKSGHPGMPPDRPPSRR